LTKDALLAIYSKDINNLRCETIQALPLKSILNNLYYRYYFAALS